MTLAHLSDYGLLKGQFFINRAFLTTKVSCAIRDIFDRVDVKVAQDREDGVPLLSLPSYAMTYLEEELQGCDSYEASRWFAERDLSARRKAG